MSWGDGTWGNAFWGNITYVTPTYQIHADGRNISTAESVWDSAIEFGPQSNMHSLVDALMEANDSVDENLTEIYNNTHIDSASGESLEQLGDLVGVERKTDEVEPRYRARIKAAFRAATIGTTFDQFVEFSATLLNTSTDNISFSTNYEIRPATVRLLLSPDTATELSFTLDSVADLLAKGVPAGHEVLVSETGTFTLREDGEPNSPENGLTADGITTGGTLLSDIVSGTAP